MPKRITMTEGDKFGRFTVVDPNVKKNHALCVCQCGNEKIVKRSHLKDGGSQSCGCLRDERIREACGTHGQGNTRMHRIWSGMLQRCRNTRNPAFPRYGGRGVRVCPEWDPQQGGSFETFAADMGEPPTEEHTLDKDKLGGGMYYGPKTCCWLDRTGQARHTRSNRMLSYNGQTKCMAEWAEVLGLRYQTLWDRLNKSGWSVEKALSTPIKKRMER